MTNPADTNIPDGATKPTENVRDLFRKSGLSMTVAEAQGYELDLYSHIFVTDKNALFKADPLNTDPDDGGATTIVDASGNRFVKVSGSADPADVIHDATEKENPVDDDELGLVDSAASWVIKKLTFANLWGWIKTKLLSSGDNFGVDLGSGDLDTTGAISCGAFTSTGIDDNADANAITISSLERIGINTTNPGDTLHCEGNAYFGSSGLRVFYATGTTDMAFQVHEGMLAFKTDSGSVEFSCNAGVQVGSPTGGYKGFGTLNAVEVYDDNVLLSCYVFDPFRKGSIDKGKWDNQVPNRIIKPGEQEKTRQKTTLKKHVVEKVEIVDDKAVMREVEELTEVPLWREIPMVDENGKPIMEVVEPASKNKPAVLKQRMHREPVMETLEATENEYEERQHFGMRKFSDRLGSEYDPLDIEKYTQHWKDKGHLTSMPNEDKFDPEKGMPTGAWIQRLIETVEIQAIHISLLHDRLKTLENQ